MRVFLALVLALVSINSYAGGSVQWNKITRIAFQAGGFFLYADNWENPNECMRADAVVLKDTDPNYDKAYAMLLAAYLAGKEVMAYSDGCHEFDEKTYNYIRGYKYLQVR